MNKFVNKDILKSIYRMSPLRHSNSIIVNGKRLNISEEYKPIMKKVLKKLDAIWWFGLITLILISMMTNSQIDDFILVIVITLLYMIVHIIVFYWIRGFYINKALSNDLEKIFNE